MIQADTRLRISIAREKLATLPYDETRAARAVRAIDRFLMGDVTWVELVQAGDDCRTAFATYAKQAKRERNPAARARCKDACVAMYAAYDAVERVSSENQPLREGHTYSVFERIIVLLTGWMVTKTAKLPPYPDTPYRTSDERRAA